MRSARATAHANLALVRYWGKRQGRADANLPAVGSLSVTLDGLRTETLLEPSDRDAIELDGEWTNGRVATRTFAHLDRVWASAHASPRPSVSVRTTNHFPTAAGLASSASGFAALTLAAADAFELGLDVDALAELARRGSGSAARSIWGGFVRLDAGVLPDGSDCRAYPIFERNHWDLRVLVVRTGEGPKSVGSSVGMRRSRDSSRYYDAGLETAAEDIEAAHDAITTRDLEALGAVMEHSCFKMHAAMMASRPPLLYWNAATVSVIHAVWAERTSGPLGFVTFDAGPHVKLLCNAADVATWTDRLARVPGVLGIQTHAIGPSASSRIDGGEDRLVEAETIDGSFSQQPLP